MRHCERSWPGLKQNKILSLLGLAVRAGDAVSGEFAVDKAGKSGRAYLLIIAEDASQNTKKHYLDMCRYYGIPFVLYGTRETIGKAVGKDNRSAAALLDQGFANSIMKQIDTGKDKTNSFEKREDQNI